MKYFILEQGKEYQGPKIKEWFGKLDVNHLRQKEWQADERMMLDIENSEFTIFPDILTHPCLMVSEALKNIIARYETRILFRSVFFIDQINKSGQLYYIPSLKAIDCFTEESLFSRDGSKVERGVVDPSKLSERNMAEASGISGQCIIISLDLAESMLRQGMAGINLTEVELAAR